MSLAGIFRIFFFFMFYFAQDDRFGYGIRKKFYVEYTGSLMYVTRLSGERIMFQAEFMYQITNIKCYRLTVYLYTVDVMIDIDVGDSVSGSCSWETFNDITWDKVFRLSFWLYFLLVRPRYKSWISSILLNIGMELETTDISIVMISSNEIKIIKFHFTWIMRWKLMSSMSIYEICCELLVFCCSQNPIKTFGRQQIHCIWQFELNSIGIMIIKIAKEIAWQPKVKQALVIKWKGMRRWHTQTNTQHQTKCNENVGWKQNRITKIICFPI